jgi:hypothetical protein
MSTVVSFACSFSNLFHEFHHHNSTATRTHSHGDQQMHEHEHSGSHHKHSIPKEEGDNDCCAGSSVELQKVEKSVSRSIEAPGAIFTTLFIAAGFEPMLLKVQPELINSENIRWRPLTTIQELRIVIQSFQI